MRKPSSKNANRISDRWLKVSTIAQENLKLAAFLFHHSLRCTFDWEVKEVQKDMMYLLEGKKKFEVDYNNPDVLPKVKPTWQGQWRPLKSTSDHIMLS